MTEALRIRCRVDSGMLPAYQTPLASGMDLKASIPADIRIEPGHTAVVPTGVWLEIPAGYEGQVRPRSGLAARHGVTLLNSPGTVDADYRGEVRVILVNLGTEGFVVTRGMRVAQIVFAPVTRAHLEVVEEISSTTRGEGGFGSTGR
jgi:dUTP pyrophosphatase